MLICLENTLETLLKENVGSSGSQQSERSVLKGKEPIRQGSASGPRHTPAISCTQETATGGSPEPGQLGTSRPSENGS